MLCEFTWRVLSRREVPVLILVLMEDALRVIPPLRKTIL